MIVPTATFDNVARSTRRFEYTGLPISAGTSDACVCAGFSASTLPSAESTRIQLSVSFWWPGSQENECSAAPSTASSRSTCTT